MVDVKLEFYSINAVRVSAYVLLLTLFAQYSTILRLFPSLIETNGLQFDAVIFAIWCIVTMAVCLFLTVKPIEQDLNYHNFADGRPLPLCGCGQVQNWQNVLSNVPFFIGSIVGLLTLQRDDLVFVSEWERTVGWPTLFIGIGLVSFGSGYYHWSPSNATLAWDRAPMTIAFMALLSILADERMGEYFQKEFGVAIGAVTIFPAVAVGLGSVIYWHFVDDLRPYVIVGLVLPMFVAPLIMLTFPGKYTGNEHQLGSAGWYLLAKVCEELDKQIFVATRKAVSGHTLKHLFASFITFQLCYMLMTRKLA